ncbi:MAG: DUF3298 domain-containing protein [Lachnoclostridium sp.]|nr:DUF3298 domain-containing protein [Lachnoclostridium sp.]
MKKYTYLALASALVLSACGNGQGTLDESTSVQAESVDATTAEASSEEAEDMTSETQEKDCEELPDKEVVYRTPLDIGLTAEYEGEWDEKGPIITADCSKILIQDDGYEELKEAVDAYNERNWQEVYTVYKEHLEYAKGDIYPEGTELAISREIELTRADSKVLSFINAEISFLGGAHGSYYENAEVFDSETGEKLELSDVVTDIDAVYQYVKNSLSENYEKESFFEGYEEWLEEMFYEQDSAMSSPLEWTLTMEGLEFSFSPYVLGPWVAGVFEVKIPYKGNEELFVEEYLCTVEHPIQNIAPEEIISADLNGDGSEDQVSFSVKWNEETYCTALTIDRLCEMEDGSKQEAKLTANDIYGTFSDAYLMHTDQGAIYLYVEFLMDNDWRKLEIVRLTDTEEVNGPELVDSIGMAVYGHFVSDPKQFTLYDRLDILGTYMVYKDYAVGGDGIPVTDDDRYRIVSYYFDWEYALTAKREIPVLMHVEGSDEKEEVKLPKGTKFRPRKTDGETVVEMELEDGRRCDILVERKPDEYIYYINGISEYEYFGDVPYAG